MSLVEITLSTSIQKG